MKLSGLPKSCPDLPFKFLFSVENASCPTPSLKSVSKKENDLVSTGLLVQDKTPTPLCPWYPLRRAPRALLPVADFLGNKAQCCLLVSSIETVIGASPGGTLARGPALLLLFLLQQANELVDGAAVT